MPRRGGKQVFEEIVDFLHEIANDQEDHGGVPGIYLDIIKQLGKKYPEYAGKETG